MLLALSKGFWSDACSTTFAIQDKITHAHSGMARNNHKSSRNLSSTSTSSWNVAGFQQKHCRGLLWHVQCHCCALLKVNLCQQSRQEMLEGSAKQLSQIIPMALHMHHWCCGRSLWPPSSGMQSILRNDSVLCLDSPVQCLLSL